MAIVAGISYAAVIGFFAWKANTWFERRMKAIEEMDKKERG
jgi:hypothetical protein